MLAEVVEVAPQVGRQLAVEEEVGEILGDKAFVAGRVDEDVPVGVVDVVGERLVGPPVDGGRVVGAPSGTFW